jgi:hypothetical protein
MRARNPEDDGGRRIGTREGSEKTDGTRTVDLMGEKMDWSPCRLDSSFRFLSNLFSSYSNKN